MLTTPNDRSRHYTQWMLTGAGAGVMVNLWNAPHSWASGGEAVMSALVGIAVQAMVFAAAARGLCWLWLRRQASTARYVAQARPVPSTTSTSLVPAIAERRLNLTRGLFRVWVVCSVAWACVPVGGFFTNGPGRELFHPLPPYAGCVQPLLPQGRLLTDEEVFSRSWRQYPISGFHFAGDFPNRFLVDPQGRSVTRDEAICWYTEDQLFSMNLGAYYNPERRRIFEARREFARTWWKFPLAMLLPPLAVLVFGWGAMLVGSWVARGFRQGAA